MNRILDLINIYFNEWQVKFSTVESKKEITSLTDKYLIKSVARKLQREINFTLETFLSAMHNARPTNLIPFI